MKKTILILITAAIAAMAEQDASQNIIDSSSYGSKVVTERNLETSGMNRPVDPWKKEIIMNFYEYRSGMRKPGIVGAKTQMINTPSVTASAASTVANTDKNVTVKGYCLVNNEIDIGKQPSSMAVECNTNVGYITLFANLKPVNEIASLLVDPVYIEKKGYRYKVLSSRVTNESRTSYNVATYVNDRKLSEIGYGTMENSANEVKTASNEYLKALEQSKTQTGVTVVSNGLSSEALQTTTTQPPNAVDYIAKAGINIVAETVKTTAQVFKKDLPYLYNIKKGSKIYIDMQVNNKEN